MVKNVEYGNFYFSWTESNIELKGNLDESYSHYAHAGWDEPSFHFYVCRACTKYFNNSDFEHNIIIWIVITLIDNYYQSDKYK